MHDSYLIPNKKKNWIVTITWEVTGKKQFFNRKNELKGTTGKKLKFYDSNSDQSPIEFLFFDKVHLFINWWLFVCLLLFGFVFVFFFCQIARNILFEISHPVQRNSFQVEVGLNSNKQVFNERRKLVFKEGNEIQNVNKKLIFCPIFFFWRKSIKVDKIKHGRGYV